MDLQKVNEYILDSLAKNEFEFPQKHFKNWLKLTEQRLKNIEISSFYGNINKKIPPENWSKTPDFCLKKAFFAKNRRFLIQLNLPNILQLKQQ